MVDAIRRRWTILGGLFAATLVACFYPVDVPPLRAQRIARLSIAASAPLLTSAAHPAFADPADVDPFAPRGWQVEPIPVLVASAPVPEPFIGPVRPPPPPPAPPLPFQFIGRLNDGAVPIVYLSHGDQTLIARTGETLEQTYKVVGMTALQIEFQHLPTGDKQLMSLPASGN